MENRNGEIHIDTDEARAGSSNNVVRWVLGIGLLLAVIGMSLAWLIPALSRGGETVNANVSREIVTEKRSDGSDTDSIVGENADSLAAPAASASGEAPSVPNQASGQ